MCLDAGQGLSGLPGSILQMTSTPQDLLNPATFPVDPTTLLVICEPGIELFTHTPANQNPFGQAEESCTIQLESIVLGPGGEAGPAGDTAAALGELGLDLAIVTLLPPHDPAVLAPLAEALAHAASREKHPSTELEQFFVTLKQMTINGYYTSEIGIHQDLEYEGNTYVAVFPGCPRLE